MQKLFSFFAIINSLTFSPGLLLAEEIQQQLCSEKIPETTPREHFIVQPDPATVLHKTTNLVWQRCLLGQQFNQGQCSGEAIAFSERNAAGQIPAENDPTRVLEQELLKYPGWRIANEKELLSIVEFRCVYPRLNTDIFPGYNKNFGDDQFIRSWRDFSGNNQVYRLVRSN